MEDRRVWVATLLLTPAAPTFGRPEAQEARTFTDGSRSMAYSLYRP